MLPPRHSVLGAVQAKLWRIRASNTRNLVSSRSSPPLRHSSQHSHTSPTTPTVQSVYLKRGRPQFGPHSVHLLGDKSFLLASDKDFCQRKSCGEDQQVTKMFRQLGYKCTPAIGICVAGKSISALIAGVCFDQSAVCRRQIHLCSDRRDIVDPR